MGLLNIDADVFKPALFSLISRRRYAACHAGTFNNISERTKVSSAQAMRHILWLSDDAGSYCFIFMPTPTTHLSCASCGAFVLRCTMALLIARTGSPP